MYYVMRNYRGKGFRLIGPENWTPPKIALSFYENKTFKWPNSKQIPGSRRNLKILYQHCKT